MVGVKERCIRMEGNEEVAEECHVVSHGDEGGLLGDVGHEMVKGDGDGGGHGGNVLNPSEPGGTAEERERVRGQ